ncbi:hypothetical protein MLD38_009256 [Melastoma candidum]|uniref:Uncharacterized protein n=2 Tax=Melastoma candidum TaxID=119954 RepID=A0ACB9S1B3_9MYRT|nr:hypothetical protein MLD38_006721 [Melastoma candidum]KAI4383418.1 hypothetical protein MLD38_009256 [Melastoma candidum]
MGSAGSKARVTSSAAASPSSNRGNFHVFLSFRGPDVHNTFLAHLHHALEREGVRTYVDREDLRAGDEIMPALRRAISDSRIAIVIFSVNFASSCWCLDELAEIVDHGKRGKLLVKPVFYRVEPREVRTPRFSFAKALDAHELKLGKDSGMLRRWREALYEAGNLSGWHLDVDGYVPHLLLLWIVRDGR